MKARILKYLIIATLILPLAPVQAQNLFVGGSSKEESDDDKPSRVFIAPKPRSEQKPSILSRFFTKKQPTYTQAFQSYTNFEIPKGFDMALLGPNSREPSTAFELLTLASIENAPKLAAAQKRMAQKQKALNEFKAYDQALRDRAEYDKKRRALAQAERQEKQQVQSTRRTPQTNRVLIRPKRVFTDF